MPIEDPFLSYDSVVSQMVADGVEWIPIDQMNKKLSEVRLVAPDSAKHVSSLCLFSLIYLFFFKSETFHHSLFQLFVIFTFLLVILV